MLDRRTLRRSQLDEIDARDTRLDRETRFYPSFFFTQRPFVSLFLFSLSPLIRRHLALLAYSLLPPSPTSYRRYVGCATSLPGNRYLAWLYTEWSSLYRCSPYTNFLRPLSRPRASSNAAALTCLSPPSLSPFLSLCVSVRRSRDLGVIRGRRK